MVKRGRPGELRSNHRNEGREKAPDGCPGSRGKLRSGPAPEVGLTPCRHGPGRARLHLSSPRWAAIGRVKSALWVDDRLPPRELQRAHLATVPGSPDLGTAHSAENRGWVDRQSGPVAATARAEGSRSAGSHRALAKARGYRRGRGSGNRRRSGAACAPVIRLRPPPPPPPPPAAGAPPDDQLPGVPGGTALPGGVLA